jgi:hypothetical protein
MGTGMMHSATYCILRAICCLLGEVWCYDTSGYYSCGSGLGCIPRGLCGLLFYWYGHLLCCLNLVFVAQTNNMTICHLRHFTLFGACTIACRNSISCAPLLAKVTFAIFKLCKYSHPPSNNINPYLEHCVSDVKISMFITIHCISH